MKKNLIILFTSIVMSVLVFSASAEELDLSSITEVYRNTFDSDSSLTDFSQHGGKWETHNGRLYLTAGENNHSFILYTGNEELTALTDYVLDVDMYNVRSQAGVIIRSDLNHITSTSNGFAGYFAFISFDGRKGAIGIADRFSEWKGNLEVSEEITSPFMNLHLRVIVFENNLHYIISDLTTKRVLWEHTEVNDEYTNGSFGFRMSAMIYDGMANLGCTSFDNLVISKIEEEDHSLKDIFSNIESKISAIVTLAQMLGGECECDFANRTVTVKFHSEDLNFPIPYEDLMKKLLSSRFQS